MRIEKITAFLAMLVLTVLCTGFSFAEDVSQDVSQSVVMECCETQPVFLGFEDFSVDYVNYEVDTGQLVTHEYVDSHASVTIWRGSIGSLMPRERIDLKLHGFMRRLGLKPDKSLNNIEKSINSEGFQHHMRCRNKFLDLNI